MTRHRKIALLVPIGIALLLVGWQVVRGWWLHGYSVGSRTGVLRKLSKKGSPLCKYMSGEMVMVGSAIQSPEAWEFTLDDENPAGTVMKTLEAAVRTAKPVTVRYRQDKGKWWACAPTEYFVTSVE